MRKTKRLVAIFINTAIASSLVTQQLWAAPSCEAQFLQTSGAHDQAKIDLPKTVMLSRLLAEEMVKARLSNLKPKARAKLEQAIEKMKIETMSPLDKSRSKTSWLINKPRLVINRLLEDSALYGVIEVHDIDHAARAVTTQDRVQRVLDYSYVPNSEAKSTAAEYQLLRLILASIPYKTAERDLKNRVIEGRRVQDYVPEWIERQWATASGQVTNHSLFIIDVFLKSSMGSIEEAVKGDPAARALLTHYYDQVFLAKLKQASEMTVSEYVDAQGLDVRGETTKHRRLLGLIHFNGLLILLRFYGG